MGAVSISCHDLNNTYCLFGDIKGVLFDLDGTLIDSLELHIQAFQWIFQHEGIYVSREELEPLLGMTPQDIIGKFLKNKSKKELWDLAIKKEEHLFELTEHINPLPGVVDFLKELKINGVITIVISSTHRSLVNRLLSTAGITQYFDDMVSGDEITHGKPDPEPFLIGIKKTGLKKNNIIGIGDSIHDIKSAFRSGIKVIGVTTGKTPAEKLSEAGANCVAENMSKLSVIRVF